MCPLPALRSRLLFAAAALVVAASPLDASASKRRDRPAPSRVDYVIDAHVDTDAMRIEGKERIVWTNRTESAASELWFHLYWNAFANSRSTHLEENRGKLGRYADEALEDGWGWQQVTSVRVGDAELLPTLRYRAPDDGNSEDRTVFSVLLPAPVGPGESVEIDVDWLSQIPRVRRRVGYKDDFLFVAHWFPKLGVFEDDGRWNCHQFHRDTEFFSHYGTYDVTLDLPAKYESKVGASGKIVPPAVRRGERVQLKFAAPSLFDRERLDETGKRPLVHGFAWTADPDFEVRQWTFHYDKWREQYGPEVDRVQAALGPEKDLRLRNVDVTVLMQPEHEKQWQRHLEATGAALFFYGLWYGAYPYEHITVVDPAWGARAAGGMEYPTLFTCGTRMFTRPSMHTPESVTVHECGHQFWYGLVGNNEFEAAWLDEGLNSYTDSEVLFRHWGPKIETTNYANVPFDGVPAAPGPGGSRLARLLSASAIPIPWTELDVPILPESGFVDLWRDLPHLTFVTRTRDPRWYDRARYLRAPDLDPITTNGWEYAHRDSYGANSYSRTAVTLRSLPAVIGQDAFLRGMRHYSESWRYDHPYPDDFFASFQEGAGVDVEWYFDELFHDTETVDWGVTVEQERRVPSRGFFQELPGGPFEELEVGAEPPPFETIELASAPDEGGGDDPASEGAPPVEEVEPWHAEVLITRSGDVRLPLTIELRYDGGRIERRTWTREQQDGQNWLRLRHIGDEKLVAVILDPDRGYYIEADRSNNRWFDEVDSLTPVRWSERVFNRYMHLLFWQSGLGG